MWRCTALLIVTVMAAGCTDQWPPDARPVHFNDVTLSEDGRSVHVEFIGFRAFNPDDACSVDYRGNAKIVDDELQVGIYPKPHPVPAGTVCDLAGHFRALDLALDEPFTGLRVRDLAGQVVLLRPPPNLARVTRLPLGWELRSEDSQLGSDTPSWRRVWSPDPSPPGPDRMLTLVQTFGGSIGTSRGEEISTVQINGQTTQLSVYPPSGEMVVRWSLGEDEFELTGNLRDFSRDEFIALAESVSLPQR